MALASEMGNRDANLLVTDFRRDFDEKGVPLLASSPDMLFSPKRPPQFDQKKDEQKNWKRCAIM